MKHFVLLLLVVSVYSDQDYVPKNRIDVAQCFRTCLSTLGISRETFKNTNWELRSNSDVVRSMMKCMVKDFGLFDETGGFNKNRVVKQFGGEEVRTIVEKCIDDNPISEPTDVTTVDKSVQNVMTCLDDNNLKLYGR